MYTFDRIWHGIIVSAGSKQTEGGGREVDHVNGSGGILQVEEVEMSHRRGPGEQQEFIRQEGDRRRWLERGT